VEHGVVFAPDRAGGRRWALAALDDPARWGRLTRGRWPAPCGGAVCEAVAVGGRAAARRVRIHGVTVRLVGAATVDPAAAGPLPPRRGALAADARYVLARGPAALAAQPSLAEIPRTYTWTRLLARTGARPWRLDATLAALATAPGRLARAVDRAELRSPARWLAGERARQRAAAPTSCWWPRSRRRWRSRWRPSRRRRGAPTSRRSWPG
jgi:hypothetical protein